MHVDTLDPQYSRLVASMIAGADALDRHAADVTALCEKLADAEGGVTLSPFEAMLAGAALGTVRSLQMTRNRIAELRCELN